MASVATSAAALVTSLEFSAAAAAIAVASPAVEAASSLLGWIVGAGIAPHTISKVRKSVLIT